MKFTGEEEKVLESETYQALLNSWPDRLSELEPVIKRNDIFKFPRRLIFLTHYFKFGPEGFKIVEPDSMAFFKTYYLGLFLGDKLRKDLLNFVIVTTDANNFVDIKILRESLIRRLMEAFDLPTDMAEDVGNHCGYIKLKV